MMRITDLIEEVYWGLSANKVRSFLTILGIVIGIASVISLQAIGAGATQSIQQNIQSVGSNLLFVTPGSQRGIGFAVAGGRGSAQSLTNDDASAILAIDGVSAVASEKSGRYQIKAAGKNTNTSVIGTNAAYPGVRNVQIDTGSFITDVQNQESARVAVLGPTTRDDLFASSTTVIGKPITIKGMPFTVIGITVSKGGSGFGNQDDVVYVPVSTAQKLLAGDDYLSTIDVQAADQSQMTQVQNDIASLLTVRHKITGTKVADFSVINQSDIVATASSVTGTLTSLLAAIAGISLLVGGIGIMNMMLTTVTERTKEIGLRQAIGAEKGDISRQFLVEAVTLTFLGGVVGTLLGYLVSLAISNFINIQGVVTGSSILLAFGVSAVIGIVFGYYPARRAAKLNPIEALRFE
jgi:putative ABC transport system permease protein